MAHTTRMITEKIVVIEFDEQHNLEPIYITDHFGWFQIVQGGINMGWFETFDKAYQYAYERLMFGPEED